MQDRFLDDTLIIRMKVVISTKYFLFDYDIQINVIALGCAAVHINEYLFECQMHFVQDNNI